MIRNWLSPITLVGINHHNM